MPPSAVEQLSDRWRELLSSLKYASVVDSVASPRYDVIAIAGAALNRGFSFGLSTPFWKGCGRLVCATVSAASAVRRCVAMLRSTRWRGLCLCWRWLLLLYYKQTHKITQDVTEMRRSQPYFVRFVLCPCEMLLCVPDAFFLLFSGRLFPRFASTFSVCNLFLA